MPFTKLGAEIFRDYVVAGIPASGAWNPVKTDIRDWAATLETSASSLGTAVNYYPVVNPSSGNIQGSGSPTTHQLVWSDANPIFWADVLNFVSVDPSALGRITITGTPANGTLTITFRRNSTDYATAVSVTAGQTTTQVAAAALAAIKANTNLWTPISSTNTAGGGYGSSKIIGFIIQGANVIDYDYDVRTQTSISYAPGTTGLTLTFQAGESTAATVYSLPRALDNNVVFSVARNPGVAIPAASQLFTINSQGTTSGSPTAIAATYGIIQNRAVSSTTGALAGSWIFALPDVNGSASEGLTLIKSALTPASNNTMALGSAILNYSQVFAYAISIPGVTSGAALIVAPAAASNPTLITPTSSGTLALINGVTDGSNAAAGVIGEIISSNVVQGSAVSATTTVPLNVTSISLTAGDWDVWGQITSNPAGTTTQSAVYGWISTVSATNPYPGPNGGAYAGLVLTFSTGQPQHLPVGMTRISVSTTTTVYLGAQLNFATSTNAAFGFIGARRIR